MNATTRMTISVSNVMVMLSRPYHWPPSNSIARPLSPIVTTISANLLISKEAPVTRTVNGRLVTILATMTSMMNAS